MGSDQQERGEERERGVGGEGRGKRGVRKEEEGEGEEGKVARGEVRS